MRKIILTSAVLLTAAIGASSFALADKAPRGDRAERHATMCVDRNARAVGHLAELEAKLKPTTAQTAAWAAYKNTLTTQSAAAEKSCLDRAAARKAAGDDKKRPTIIERQAMMEKGLEAKLANLKATQPSLTALYATLSDDQKQVMDRSGKRHGKFAGRHGKNHGGMDHKAGFERHHDKADAPVEQ
ncbi:MAG: Spy/CpxP family protein refolding chaperone [Parvibaculum sp.]|nr:Spy/CpxP family protein refolding chaperone [Parvibaculum sp.]